MGNLLGECTGIKYVSVCGVRGGFLEEGLFELYLRGWMGIK